jgi:hypothetical protein
MCANSKYSNTSVRELATLQVNSQGFVSSLGSNAHATELDHLMALDNRINYDFSPLHSTAIYPKHTHTPYGVLSVNTKTYLIPLP